MIITSRSLSLRIYRIDISDNGPASLELSRTIRLHKTPVITAVTDQTGTLLATGASDGIVKVLDIRGGYTTHTLHGHGSIISALCFFRMPAHSSRTDAQRLRIAAGSEDGKIRVWDLQTRKPVAMLSSHVSVVRSLAYQDSTTTLMSGSRDKTAMLWDAFTWKSKTTIPVLESVESIGFLNGSLIFTGGESGNLRIWQSNRVQELTSRQDKSHHGILQAFYASSPSYILTVHADQTLLFHSTTSIGGTSFERIKDAKFESLPVIRNLSGTHDEIIDFGFVGNEKSLLAIATNSEDVKILSLKTSASGNDQTSDDYFGSDVGLLQGHEDIVICLDIDWSGNWLVSGAKDNNARLWRIDAAAARAFTCIASFTGHTESLGAVALPRETPQSSSAAYNHPLDHPPRFLVTGSQDKTIKYWDLSSLSKDPTKSPRAIYTRKAHDKDINAIDINHSSKLFASASQDRTVKIWNLEDGEAIGVLRGHRRGVWAVRFAPSDFPSIRTSGEQINASRGLVLTGSGDRTVKIWNLTDYSCLRTFEGHTNSVLKVLWLVKSRQAVDDGDEVENTPRATTKQQVQVASSAGDGLVKVWNVPEGELATTLDNHTDRVWALAQNPIDGGLVSGGGDSVVTFWKDTTSNTVAAAAAASTARVEQDQQLQNFIRGGSYREAITLALQLGHPARLLALFTSVVATYPPEEESLCGVKAVDEVLANLADEQLCALLMRIRDWNASAKTAPVAQKVLWTIFQSYSPRRLMNLRSFSRGTGLKEVLDALRAYTERNCQRAEVTLDESYLVDYTLQEMGQKHVNGVLANGVMH